MKRFGFKLFIAAAFYGLLLGCGSEALKEKQKVTENGIVPGDIPAKLTLYSIDFREAAEEYRNIEEPEKPKNDGKERIGDYIVLGKIEIKDPQQRKEIMDSIREAIRKPVDEAKCFWPRHLIRVEEREGASELVICFECSRYMASGHLATEGIRPISDQPKVLLNSILKDAKIEMVPEDH
jgi:hypothetical protein